MRAKNEAGRRGRRVRRRAGFLGHAVAQEAGGLKALIAAAPAILGPGFFVPTRNGALLRWLLDGGMRMAWPP